MKVIFHRSLEALTKQAHQDKKEIFETDTSFSYRIFEDGQTVRLNIYYKQHETTKPILQSSAI